MTHPDPALTALYARAAHLLEGAEALIITAGAGMGVDSGLPDFRGDEGFWRAYPPLRGFAFAEMANPRWFTSDPHRAWGFYGHRLNLYRATEPHEGFHILRRWARGLGGSSSGNSSDNYFVFTSNVDGQFQKAGFSPDRCVECHGSIHHAQPLNGNGGIYSAEPLRVDVDEATLRARDPLPSHPEVRGLPRPNILMFGDGGWDSARTDAQERRLGEWLGAQAGRRVLVVEMGAGTAIPSVRSFGERLVEGRSGVIASLIRINPRESHAPSHLPPGRVVSIPMGALEGLRGIEAARGGLGG